MVDRLYPRHSTDKQTEARQRHALAKLIKAGAPLYEDPATSSRVLVQNRAGFKDLLDESGVGDTVRIADAPRLFRSVGDVIAPRPVIIRRGLPLKVESGLLAGIDLAADDAGTKTVVSVLAAVLEFQRYLISENSKEGVAAAEAAGKTLGRPAALDQGEVVELVEACREGAPPSRHSPGSTASIPGPSAAYSTPSRPAVSPPVWRRWTPSTLRTRSTSSRPPIRS